MGRYANEQYEGECRVPRPFDEVWEALQVDGNGQPRFLDAWPCMPGFDRTGRVVATDPFRSVTVHKTSEPCSDSEIVVEIESISPATTGVRVVQRNLPPWVAAAIEVFVIGGDQILQDLALYLTHGVSQSRHSMKWAFSGIGLAETDCGLVVTGAMPGTFGERLQLHAGDVLLTLGDAPVFTQRCVTALLRVLNQGDTVAATWVREGELMNGSAAL